MYCALVIVITKFVQTDELKEIALGVDKIDIFRSLFERLGFHKDNILVVSDVEGEDGAECISTPEKLISHLTTKVKSKVSGGVLMTFLVTHGVRLLTDEGYEPGLCMKQSEYSHMTNAWKNVLPVATLGETLRAIGAESVLLVLEACHGSFGGEEEWRTEVDGFTQISNMPDFLGAPAPEESIKGMYLLFSTSSEEQGHEGSHLTKFIDECLSGRGRVDEQGNVRASHFVLQLCRDMPHPPHLTAWRMHKSQDFVLSPRPVVSDSQIPANKLENILLIDWKKDADNLLNMVKAKVRTFGSISIQESEHDVLSRMEKLLERIKEERKGMDEGHADYGTPSRISSYRHSWETLLIELGATGHLLTLSKLEHLMNRKTYPESRDILPPPHLVAEQICLDRQSEVDSLWKKVCGSESGVVGIVGIHGMGGIGKTILAQLLFRRPEVKSKFPDGQYWITVGESDNPAELLESQTQLYRALTKEWDASFASVGSAKTALQSVIGNKRCLIVLDDVWKSRNVIGSFGSNVLQEGNRGCRFLVTTRNSAVLGNGVVHSLEYLTPEETMRLLKEESKCEVNCDEKSMKELASLCGESPVPLVVSILGSLLQEYLGDASDSNEAAKEVSDLIRECGVMYMNIPHALDEREMILETTLMSSLDAVCREKCMEKYGDLKILIYDLSVFPEDTRIPKKLLEHVWVRRNVPRVVGRKLLTKLARMSLIQRFENDDLHFGIHDSIRCFLTAKCDSVEICHRLLVDTFIVLCGGETKGSPWWKGEESDSLSGEILDYMRSNLTYHLSRVKDMKSIFGLATSLDWIVYGNPLDVMLKDCRYLENSEYKDAARLISSSIELSLLSYSKEPSREGLAFQLYSRLFKSGCERLNSMLKDLNSVLPFEVKQSMLEPPWGSLIRVFEGHDDRVESIALTSDDCFAVSGSYDKSIRVWNLKTGECENILKGHNHYVTSVALTSDDSHVVSGSWDKTVRTWNLKTEECEKVLRGHNHYVTSVALTNDDSHAVSGSWDKTLRFWNLETGNCVRILNGHTRSVSSVAISLDNVHAISGSSDRTLRLWNLQTGRCERVMKEHTGWIASVAITSDSSHALSGSRDKTLRFWNLETGNCERVMEGHRARVASVPFSSDCSHAISSSGDKTLRVWNIETGHCEKILEGHTWTVTAVGVTSDNTCAVSGCKGGSLRIWRLGAKHSEELLEKHSRWVTSVALSSDLSHAISGSRDNTARIWNIETGECEKVLKGHTSFVSSVALTSDGLLAVSGSDDNTLRIWNLETGVCEKVLEGHVDWVTSIALTSDDCFAVSGSYDKSIRVWNLETGECEKVLKGHTSFVTSVALTSDGLLAISGSNDCTLRIWSLETGDCEKVLEGHTKSVNSVALTSDDHRAVSGSNDCTLRVWDLETGECEKVLEGHTDSVNSVAITSDGFRVFSGSKDKTLRIWNLETGECIFSVSLTPSLLTSVGTRGEVVVTGLSNGKVGFLLSKPSHADIGERNYTKDCQLL